MKQIRFGSWMAVLFLVLLVNTAYLAAFASPTIFYMSNVLLHLVDADEIASAGDDPRSHDFQRRRPADVDARAVFHAHLLEKHR